MNKLNIKPDGNLIKGGTICYQIKPSGQVDLSVMIKAHYLFSDHDLEQSGTYQVEQKLVQSKNVETKEKVEIGSLSLSVQSVQGHLAVASAYLDVGGGRSAHGTAMIDLSDELIALKSIQAKGVIFGQPFTIETE